MAERKTAKDPKTSLEFLEYLLDPDFASWYPSAIELDVYVGKKQGEDLRDIAEAIVKKERAGTRP